jgi:AraC-like DNA-binding protein
MDALSDVLRAVRLTGAVFFDVRAHAPWVAETPRGAAIVRRIFPSADHLIPYHLLAHGACWAGVAGAETVAMQAGDIVLFPQGHAHVLSSDAGLRSTPNLSLYRRPDDRQLPFNVSMGSSPHQSAQLICGYLGCDARPYNPLLQALPAMIHIAHRPGDRVETLLRFAHEESRTPRPGGESVLARLSELMFVEVIRAYSASLADRQMNWLTALRDAAVGRALAALHYKPAHSWTVAALARHVGVSRSVLAERFTQFVGRPPMQYLADWRMQLASDSLRKGEGSIAQIADRVGYGSEAAFSRAFKKLMGESPDEWRRLRGRANE